MSENEQALSDLVAYQRTTIRKLRIKIERALLNARTMTAPALAIAGEETQQVPTRLIRELVEELE